MRYPALRMMNSCTEGNFVLAMVTTASPLPTESLQCSLLHADDADAADAVDNSSSRDDIRVGSYLF